MADTEIPGSYRRMFVDGPKGGETTINETGAPSTIEGDATHTYQLVASPEYPADLVTAPDVVVSVYQWTELHAPADEVGGSYN